MQPNIVLITCDHLRADLMGCAGHEIIQTPHIDLLAKRGVRFTQAYSTTPVCIPARASIMTGLHGHHLGVTELQPGFEIPVEETLPKQLSKVGYQTLVVGKMHTYPERCHYGFDNMILWEEGRRLGETYGEHHGYGDYEQWLAEQGYAGLAFAHGMTNNEYAMSPWHLPDHLHPTEWIGYQTCKEIKRRDWTRPLFIWSSFTAPHPPITPLLRDLYLYEQVKMPQPVVGDWAEKHPIFHQIQLAQHSGGHKTDLQIDLAFRAFYASVTQVDRQINRIIGTLREEGMLENTWFIFTSDHGDNLGDHHLWAKTNFLKGSCNIPMIVTPPIRAIPVMN
ncbi:sulfatase-like hydrolase/transferase [Alicyclobacillus tolerans]|uniref:sulfatase-like hydrolase/transferase n=1 Tax=Alicyclobacillus tolerans TaxID=90970 RepID=UPI001F005BA2|nr:sulfatase-like hydrolase/transferase [Alicyclobacillus tolerans]MCF8563824.1 sulfatase-like hydrolase/transferase [Alicyclobacillus tolerans]